MPNPTVILLFSLLILEISAETNKYYTFSNATEIMHSLELAKRPQADLKTFQLIRSLIATDKTTGDDIRSILDEVNEIRRKIAADKNISNSHLVHWNTSLAVMANLQECGSLHYFNRDEDGRQLHGISNDFQEFWNQWRVSDTNPFWIEGLLNPKTSAIGCATKNCEFVGADYEVFCVMQPDPQETIPGLPGTGCPAGTNDNGLCNNRGISKASAILSVILMLILVD